MTPHDELTEHGLEVIDRTLAGDPVAPADAELAELTLLLAAERPPVSAPFAEALDARVDGRFAVAPSPARSPAGRPRLSERLRPRVFAPGLAGVAGLAAGVLVAVVIVLGQGSPSVSNDAASSSSSASSAAPALTNAGSSSSSGSAASSAAGTAASGVAAPTAPGRQVVQGASLSLSARPGRISDVARQVFGVVAAQHGFVDSSNVTSGAGDAGAQFSLTVPSANLSAAMAALSQLHGATVVSRNDVSQDVTGRAGGAGRRLADARALRTTLLRKLALATTTADINSLHLQIRDANASIASDLATLRGIRSQVANSQIQLSIGVASPQPAHPAAHSGGFGIGRALHSAGRVLVVAAGVGLIALAVLVPVGLLAALGAWVAHLVVRRRREQALDLG